MDTNDRDLDQKAGPVQPGAAKTADSAEHDAYWRDNFGKRPYVTPGSSYEDFGPAYRHGLATVRRYEQKSFGEAEAEIRDEWHGARGSSKLEWDTARHAVRDAWDWVKTDVDHD